MSRTAANFKQDDVKRAIRGAKAAGLEVARVTISRDGSIELDTGNPQSKVGGEGGPATNPWDTI